MLAVSFAATSAAAAGFPWPADRRLAFEVWRGGHRIGRHTLAFSGSQTDFAVAIEAIMAVSLGPITLFRYHHQARETWRGGRFAELESHTLTNGKRDQVSAIRTGGGVAVTSATGARTLPASSLPLTHWNQHALAGPLFNPQTGLLMRETVSRQAGQTLRAVGAPPIAATRYALSGETEIIDWYDAGGEWASLQAKATDGSWIDYRRAA